MSTALVPELMLLEMPCEATYEGLRNEVRTALHDEAPSPERFKNAADRVFRDHNVANAFTREVLLCEIYADIRKERRKTSIPFTKESLKKNFIEYVRVLLHYGFIFQPVAADRALAQFKIGRYSSKNSELVRAASNELNQRSRQRKNILFNPVPEEATVH